MDQDFRFTENYDNIRSAFEETLIDQWYSPHLVSEVDDWRSDFVDEEYKIYLSNLK